MIKLLTLVIFGCCFLKINDMQSKEARPYHEIDLIEEGNRLRKEYLQKLREEKNEKLINDTKQRYMEQVREIELRAYVKYAM